MSIIALALVREDVCMGVIPTAVVLVAPTACRVAKVIVRELVRPTVGRLAQVQVITKM